MRVYISVDMEGIAGVVHEQQTDPVDPRFAAEYARSCRLMTGEANAAIEGALAAGASGVVVNDSHWLMRNLIAEELHEEAELISGNPKTLSMVEGIGGGFDALFFIGYHGRAGTARSTIDHTYTDRIYDVRVNGVPVGEMGLNAAVAGCFGVPVALVSGDQSVAAEAVETFGDHVETVVVKEAVSRHAARCLSPTEARRRIRAAAESTLRRPHPPYLARVPVTIETDFARTVHADMAELVPGSERIAARTVRYRHDDYREAFRAWRAMYNLAGTE
ncbi:MAG TPA: M55 family metallopeptidase [Gemmatimonadales bacterium]|nr:M55 family metallopeptidase [Gemmatimonadales bacterium]